MSKTISGFFTEIRSPSGSRNKIALDIEFEPSKSLINRSAPGLSACTRARASEEFAKFFQGVSDQRVHVSADIIRKRNPLLLRQCQVKLRCIFEGLTHPSLDPSDTSTM